VQRASNGVPDYYDRLEQAPAFEEIAMYRTQGVTVGGQGQGEPERVTAMPVTPSFFTLLRAQPLRGRIFTEGDSEVGNERKVILSYGAWQRWFAGRDEAIGQDLRINGNPYAVVGVMPQGWKFIDPEVALWIPAAFTPEQRADSARHNNSWQQMGRLRPGATLQQAQAQIDAINARNLDRFPETRQILINAGFTTHVRSFQEDLVENSRRTLYLLWGGVLVVLVIGCVNVANLVSIRASTRARELATRHALGASVQRLSRQMMTETLLLAVIGGLAGLALGRSALDAVTVLGFDALPRGSDIALDLQVMLFSFGLVIVVGAAVGLFPVVAVRRANLAQMVREEGRSGTPSRQARLVRRVLVTTQVAFALVLLVGAGLLLASFQKVLAVEPGFQAEGVLTGNIALPTARYQDEAAVRAAAEALLDRIRALPGVDAAGLTNTIPMGGSYNDSVILAEGYQMAPGESLVSPSAVVVSDGYFEAMRTRLVRGRLFDARDRDGTTRSIIIDERLANKFWPGQDPIGRHMYQPNDSKDLLAPPPREQWYTVIGVVEDVRLLGLVDRPDLTRVGTYYFPLTGQSRNLTLAVRTSVETTSMTSAIRREIASLDPELPFYNVRTMTERVEQSLVDRRTPMLLALSFASAALFLAAIGIYGVLAYQVSQRRREIGIRMALGAATGSIFTMVLREGALIVFFGAVAGLAGAYALRQTLQSQLYEVGAMEPSVVASVAGVLMVVALVACLLPARRAAKTDPVIALND
jgi:predicted permease